MSPQQGNSSVPQAQPPPDQGKRKKSSPDLHALAERVYRLLKEEARVDRERQGPRRGK